MSCFIEIPSREAGNRNRKELAATVSPVLVATLFAREMD
jgi:hypothetical protein